MTDTTQSSAPNVRVMAEFEDLIGQYWDIAFAEGKSGVPQGTEANEVLNKLRACLKLAAGHDFSAMVKGGTKAWEDVQNASTWVDDLRGGVEPVVCHDCNVSPSGVHEEICPEAAAQQYAGIELAETNLCIRCDGEGVRHTGIDEAPTTQCNACDGTGFSAQSQQGAVL